MKKLIISLAAILALSSCGIYSKYKPVTEIPDGLYGHGGTDTPGLTSADPEIQRSDTAANFGNLSWREVFTDPYLRVLIDSALVRNTDLRTAHLRVKEAEATLLSARLSYLPAFSLSPQGTASSFDGGKATQTYSLPVSASWEIDIFGRLTNAKRRAQAVVAQSRDYEQAVQTQLIAAVANNYFTLLMLDAQIEISTATEAAWKESVATTRAMKAAGMVTEAALSQTEATYYNMYNSARSARAAQPSRERPFFAAGGCPPPYPPRTSGRPTAPGESIGRRTPADTLQPARRTQCRTVAGTGILHYQCCPFRLLPLDHTEWQCGMDQFGRCHDCQPR